MKKLLYLLLAISFCGTGASTFAEGYARYVSCTIEAIADCSDLAYRVRVPSEDSFTFELVAERNPKEHSAMERPTKKELMTALERYSSNLATDLLIFRLAKNPFDGVKGYHYNNVYSDVRSMHLDVPAPGLVGLTIDLGDSDGAISAINQIGTYVGKMDEAIATVKSRFSMNVDTTRKYCTVKRLAVFRSQESNKLWYYDRWAGPRIRSREFPKGTPSPKPEELKAGGEESYTKTMFSDEVVLFFDDGTFRDPLRRMFQAGNDIERLYAAFRLRAYPDEEVVKELMQVVEASQSAVIDPDDVALAAEQSLHAMGKLKTISEKASKIYDRFDSPLQGIFELDVETLQLSWAGESYTPAD
jgi:hypothetical protein